MKRYALTLTWRHAVALAWTQGAVSCPAETTIHAGTFEAETRDDAIRRFRERFPACGSYAIRAEYLGRVRPWAKEEVA
jgi:hypothetical protein